MSGEPVNRRLPARLAETFLHAAGAEMGIFSLNMMLRQAGLDRIVDHPSAPGSLSEICSADYTAFLHAVREYFGRGARGTLNRIGRRAWQEFMQNAPLGQRIGLFFIQILPRATRRKLALEQLAGILRGDDGKVSVHLLDTELIFLDQSSDGSFGVESSQPAAEPLCWVTLGMIQEALIWAVGDTCEVEEITCRAAGGETCKFLIKELA